MFLRHLSRPNVRAKEAAESYIIIKIYWSPRLLSVYTSPKLMSKEKKSFDTLSIIIISIIPICKKL